MPTFQFRVGTPEGEVIDREVSALNLESARAELVRQGLHVFHAKRGKTSFASFLPRGRRIVSNEKFLMFNQELLALVRAGLPIVQSFEIILERQRQPRFREILTEVREKIKSGIALSDAFASYGDQFPPIYSTSLRAGERSGDLEGVLRRFLRYQKLILGLRKRVISAIIYPTVLILLSFGMMFIMLTRVIPQFSEFYAGFGAELPPLTRGLINFSSMVRDNLVLSLAIVGLLTFAIYRWTRTVTGGVAFDRFKLRIPFVGDVLQRFAIMQFTQSLGTLLGGGTPMVPAIEIASQSVTNRHVSQRVAAIAQRVREGEPLYQSLESTAVMSDLAVEMIKVGESTGSLVEMLGHVSEFYDEEIETRLARMVAVIEPMILVAIALAIGLLLYAFYLPMFQLMNVGQT